MVTDEQVAALHSEAEEKLEAMDKRARLVSYALVPDGEESHRGILVVKTSALRSPTLIAVSIFLDLINSCADEMLHVLLADLGMNLHKEMAKLKTLKKKAEMVQSLNEFIKFERTMNSPEEYSGGDTVLAGMQHALRSFREAARSGKMSEAEMVKLAEAMASNATSLVEKATSRGVDYAAQNKTDS